MTMSDRLDGTGAVNRALRASRHLDANFAWPTDAIDDFTMTFLQARPFYRKLHQAEPTRVRLTKSGLFAEAYAQARGQQAAWLGKVRPARWTSPTGEVYRQLGLAMSLATLDDIDEDVERLDADSAALWGDGFRLTKSHLVLAAVQHGLKNWEQWLHLVPNDPRLLHRSARPTYRIRGSSGSKGGAT